MTISKETILAIVRDYHGLEVTDAELELVLADLRRYERIMNMLEELDLTGVVSARLPKIAEEEETDVQ